MVLGIFEAGEWGSWVGLVKGGGKRQIGVVVSVSVGVELAGRRKRWEVGRLGR